MTSVWSCGGDDDSTFEDRYLAANQAILDELPTFPGSERRQVTSAPYQEGDSADSPIAGYTTNVIFSVPEETSAEEIVAFYEEELSGDWQSSSEESPIVDQPSGEQIGTVLTATFTRDGATVSVNTDGIATGGSTFEIGIDSGG